MLTRGGGVSHIYVRTLDSHCQLDPKKHFTMKYYLKFKSFHENAFANIVCEMAAMSQPQCVKLSGALSHYGSQAQMNILAFGLISSHILCLDYHDLWISARLDHCAFSAWWRHKMETFSALLATCAGNSPVLGEFPAQRPVTRSFDVLFDLRLNKRLSKQSWGWWFETRSWPLRRHCNAVMLKWAIFTGVAETNAVNI